MTTHTILYRISRDTRGGMWYTSEGTYHRFLTPLKPTLPMEWDARFKKGGNWLSACDSLEMLGEWFNETELSIMAGAGYEAVKLVGTQVKTLNNHPVFLPEYAKTLEHIPFEHIPQ